MMIEYIRVKGLDVRHFLETKTTSEHYFVKIGPLNVGPGLGRNTLVELLKYFTEKVTFEKKQTTKMQNYPTRDEFFFFVSYVISDI